MIFRRIFSFVLAIAFIVYGCGRGIDKRSVSQASSNYGWFITHRNIPPDGLKQCFFNKNMKFSYPTNFEIIEAKDSLLLLSPGFDDDKSFLVAVVYSSFDYGDVLAYQLTQIKSFKSKYPTYELKPNSKFYLIESVGNRSILFGELTIDKYTLKTCIVNDSTNMFEFTLSYPASLFDDSIDIDYSKFINSFLWNGERVVPSFDYAEMIEIEFE